MGWQLRDASVSSVAVGLLVGGWLVLLAVVCVCVRVRARLRVHVPHMWVCVCVCRPPFVSSASRLRYADIALLCFFLFVSCFCRCWCCRCQGVQWFAWSAAHFVGAIVSVGRVNLFGTLTRAAGVRVCTRARVHPDTC